MRGSHEGEVHFFNTADHQGGERAYRAHFPPREPGKAVGEKSPNYLFFPGTAERAHRVVPKAKLLVILRNPVDRAFSHYHHSRKLGREPLSFEEALDKEAERTAVDPAAVAFRAYSYVAKGIYVDQLAEWFRYFDRSQCLILKSEEMYEDPRAIFATVQRFVGVPEVDLGLGKKYRHKGRYREPMAPGSRARLEALFEPHNRRLYEYLGRDFGW